MKQWKMRLIALALMLAVLLSGCTVKIPGALQGILSRYMPVKYEDMEYTRPDPTALQEALDACMDSAAGSDFDRLEVDLYAYTLQYQTYYTNYSLANINYCRDLTDIYWTDEYNYCLQLAAQIDAGRDQLMYALAASPSREKLETEEFFGEGYFDDYQGESIYDETFTGMMDQESALISQYYDLSAQAVEAQADTYYDVLVPQMCQVYVELVLLRQRIAAYAGYGSYPDFAYDFYYARDYTTAQERAYLAQVRQELVPIYRELYTYGVSGIRLHSCEESETYAYVQELAMSMGGIVQEAFELMDEAGLCDITYSDNKYDASFEVFLSLYGEPYVFMNPTGKDYDFLTFTHEFGHFCNDYASYGSGVSVDVAEIFSQGLEYLSFFYVDAPGSLEKYKMLDSLCVYVEQSCYADFEQRAYAMEPEELTVENVFELFRQVGSEYGFDSWDFDGRMFVGVTHFFTNPCYVFSYVVSNDAALQLYQLEKAEQGAGLTLYQEQLDTGEYSFLAFLESAGLESPFAQGRIEAVRDTLRSALR